MATMVALILNKGESVSKTYAGANSFTDCVGHWASGAIALASAQGIISGVGNGKFNPDAPVTGAQASRMLVSALGYDTKSEGIGGAQWATKAVAVAKKAGLLDGLDTMNVNAVLTRDQACQMMFNALKADMVEYETKATSVDLGTIGSINVGGSTAKAIEITGEATKNYAGSASGAAGLGTKQLCEDYFPNLKLGSDDDDFGIAGNKWTYKKGVTTESVGPYTAEADFVYTASVSAKDMASDLKGYTINVTPALFTKNAKADDTSKTTTAAIAALTGNGKVVRLYATDATIDEAVVITPSTAEVSIKDVKATSSRGAYTEYKVDGTGYKVFTTVVNEDKDEDTAVVSGDVQDGAYVTYYKDANGKVHIDATTEVTGIITKKSGSELTISGTKYTIGAADNGSTYATSKTDETTVALDQYGYVVAKVEGADNTLYGMVLDIANAYTTSDGGKLKDAKIATIATTDGKVEDLNVKTTTSSSLKGKVVKYSEKDGVYTLTEITDTTTGLYSTFTTITKASTKLGTVTGSVKYVGNSTLFVFANYDGTGIDRAVDGTVTTVTGYKNVKGYTGSFAALDTKAADDRNGIATVVFVYDDVNGTSANNFVYLTGFTYDEDGAKAEAVIDGEVRGLDMGDDGQALVDAIASNANGKMFSKLDISDVDFDEANDAPALTEYKKVSVDGTILFTNNADAEDSGEAAADAKLYVIVNDGDTDGDVNVTVTDIGVEGASESFDKATDDAITNIYIDIDDDNVISAIYVIKNA